ncbi:PREDICTED: uncharacterized protein LOC106809976 [Priapulus caudatus]|uniref:Uncharacterized protein LOC106809976 n=1 Tax=Priapulus caudatus TaxID=37621 RepID=A0ABM1E931_PRICU|nr:PREDICTED: uncharacterized protein LOC106809976 [Priapulus caudatus]
MTTSLAPPHTPSSRRRRRLSVSSSRRRHPLLEAGRRGKRGGRRRPAAAGEAGVKIEYAAARSAVIGGYVAAGGSAMFPPMCRCDACAYASRINPLLLHRGAYGSAFSAVPPHHHAYGAPPGVPFPHDEYSCFYQPAGPMIQTFTDTCVLPKPVAMRIPQSDKTELQAPPAVHAGHRRAAFISAAADLYSGKRRAEGCEIVLKRERRERGNPGGAEKEGEDCEIVLKKERRERGNPGGAEKEEEDCEIVLKRERRERGNPGGAEKEEEGCEIVLKRERRDRGSPGGTEKEEGERRSLAIEERLDIKEEPHPLPAVHGLCKTVGSSGGGGGALYLGCKLPSRSSAEGRARDGGSSDTRARDGGSCETRARDGGSSETRARDGGSSETRARDGGSGDERRRDGRSGSTREGDETSDKDRDAREGPRRRKVFPGRNDVHGRAIEPRCKNGNDDAHRKLTADDDDKRTLVASAHAAAVVADNKRTLVVSASSAPCLPLPMVVQVDKTGRVSAELRQGGKSAGQSSACRRGGARPANPASTEKRMKGCSKSDWPANPSAEKRGKSRQLCAAGRSTARPAAGSGSRSGSRSPPRSKTRKSPCETACIGGGGATCKPDAGGRGSRAATEGAAKSRSTTPSGVKRSKVDGTRADADQRALVRQVGKQRLHQTNGSGGGGGNERKSVSPAVTKGGERRPRTDGGGGERSRTHAPDAQDAKRGGGVGRRKLSVGWEFDGPSAEKPVYHQNDAPTRLRQCYEAIRHEEGDVIRVRDCVLLRSGFRKKDLPFVAKISAFYENPDDGEIMMGLLWYYRPEHTELTNLPTCVAAELFASKHQDENNVACIEDKCYVLTPHEYARYCKEQRIKGERHRWRDLAIVPASEDPFLRRDRQPVPTTHPDLVFVCRRVYDFRQKRLLKNPFK